MNAMPTVRSAMAEVAANSEVIISDLIDVSDLCLDDLVRADGSSLTKALERILATDQSVASNNFQASI